MTIFSCMAVCLVQGNYDPLLGSSSRNESAEEAKVRLQQDEAEVRNAVG